MKQYLWGGENAFVFSFYFPIWGQAHLSVSQDTETVEIDKRVSWWKSDCDVISVICNHWNQNQCDQWRDHCDQNANQLMLSFNWKEIGDRIFINVVSSLGCTKSSPWSYISMSTWKKSDRELITGLTTMSTISPWCPFSLPPSLSCLRVNLLLWTLMEIRSCQRLVTIAGMETASHQIWICLQFLCFQNRKPS